jgi:hypothetical protein
MRCDEAHLFRSQAGRPLELIMSVPEDHDASALTGALSRIESVQPSVQMVADVRYRVLPFKANDALAIAALREGPDTIAQVPEDMIAELGQLLSEDTTHWSDTE